MLGGFSKQGEELRNLVQPSRLRARKKDESRVTGTAEKHRGLNHVQALERSGDDSNLQTASLGIFLKRPEVR